MFLLPQIQGVQGVRQACPVSQSLSPGPEDPQGIEASPRGSEIAEDADVGKVSPVAVGVKAEQEGPLEGNEAPDTGEVVAVGVREACRGEEPHGDLRGLCPGLQPPCHKPRATPPHQERWNVISTSRAFGVCRQEAVELREGQSWPIPALIHLLCPSTLTLGHLDPAGSFRLLRGRKSLCLLAGRSHQGALPSQSWAEGPNPRANKNCRLPTCRAHPAQHLPRVSVNPSNPSGGGRLGTASPSLRKPRHGQVKWAAQAPRT